MGDGRHTTVEDAERARVKTVDLALAIVSERAE
jgi:hypothetical protein